MFGIKWIEFNKKDQLVYKERSFSTEKERDAFINKLEVKDNFYKIEAWLN